MRTLICVKNPKPFETDYMFEVPEALKNSGYVNTSLDFCKEWYTQVYPVVNKEVSK